MKNFAFARKKVVLDIQAIHGFEMSPKDCGGNQISDFGSLIAALLDGMERLQTDLKILFVLLVPLRYASVEIPAVVIEARLKSELFNFSFRFFLQVQESHNDIRHLDTGVIDIVLNIHIPGRGS